MSPPRSRIPELIASAVTPLSLILSILCFIAHDRAIRVADNFMWITPQQIHGFCIGDGDLCFYRAERYTDQNPAPLGFEHISTPTGIQRALSPAGFGFYIGDLYLGHSTAHFNGSIWTAVAFPFIVPAILLALPALFYLIAAVRARRALARYRFESRCPRCGFDMLGSPTHCPKCHARLPEELHFVPAAPPPRRRWLLLPRSK